MAEAGTDVRRQYDELAFENFFQRFNLQDLKDAFVENGFRTCRSLMIVTDEDLKEIGISSLGLRKELLGAVEEWKKPLLQKTGNSGPDKNAKTSTNPPAFSPSSGVNHPPNISSQDVKPSPQLYSPNTGQYSHSPLIRYKESPGTQGSPIFHPGASPASPGSEKFHRIKRNESCPYPECTWAGLSTHFHCLICSSFHTNKTARIRQHIQRHEGGENNDLDEYQKVKREQFFIFSGKECPEQCKYSEQGVRHLHCKHCDWRTKKFDSRLLAHFKSHHERHLLQYQSGQDIGSPTTTMANIRTVSPLPTMAVQEAVQIADAQVAKHDGTSLPRPPKLLKMETPDGERAVAVHIQPGGYLNRPSVDSEEGSEEASATLEGDMSEHGKHKCMVCGETQGLRTALMREQKGRNGPIDWNKTKQLFAYHRLKTTQPAIHWICQKHIEEFVYFSRAYLSMWSTAGVHQHLHTPPSSQHSQHPHMHSPQSSQHQHHNVASPEEGEVSENTLVSGMPVYMMLNEHLNEQYKREPEGMAEEEAEERE